MAKEADTCRKLEAPKLQARRGNNDHNSIAEKRHFADGRTIMCGSIAQRQPYLKSLLMFAVLPTILTSCDFHTPASAKSPSENASFHSAVPHISEIEAKSHVGQYVVVTGMVKGYSGKSDTYNVYLYFDPNIEHPTFAVLWPGTNHPPDLSLKSLILNAKTISVCGRIVLELNVPEIIIDSRDQIQIN